MIGKILSSVSPVYTGEASLLDLMLDPCWHQEMPGRGDAVLLWCLDMLKASPAADADFCVSINRRIQDFTRSQNRGAWLVHIKGITHSKTGLWIRPAGGFVLMTSYATSPIRKVNKILVRKALSGKNNIFSKQAIERINLFKSLLLGCCGPDDPDSGVPYIRDLIADGRPVAAKLYAEMQSPTHGPLYTDWLRGHEGG